jgi:hypothetical protein
MAQTDQGLQPARVVIVVRRRKAGLEEFLTSSNVAHLPDDPRRALLGLHAQRSRRISGHGQGRLQPSQPFAQAAGLVPEAAPERRGKPQHRLVPVGLLCPGQRRPDVRLLRSESAEPCRLVRSPQLGLGPLRKGHEVREVAVPQPDLVRLQQLIPRELADGFQHPEPRLAIRIWGDRQDVLFDQVVKAGEHVGSAVWIGRIDRDRLRGDERESAGEHTQRGEDALVGLAQQVEAPPDRGAERALPDRCVHRSFRKDRQSPIQASEKGGRCEEPGAGRGQLDRQRQAVQAGADTGDRDGVVAGEREGRVDRPGPLDEQLHCLDLSEIVERSELHGVR